MATIGVNIHVKPTDPLTVELKTPSTRGDYVCVDVDGIGVNLFFVDLEQMLHFADRLLEVGQRALEATA